ncbi:MAG TPA: TssQ family T6SS-associated lipoprotein [Burkholderiaceae bacterium]|nr:TssQ family T6SS-associated lipoprotein [Burkholderiaceae bacterium]
MRVPPRLSLCAVALSGLAACVTPPPPPPPPTQSIVALYQRPAERSLIDGMRYYEEGSFERAETAVRSALAQGLRDPRDAATAHKYLAFLACAFNRLAECEQQFREAFAADGGFALSDVEIGHPVWGPIYRKVVAARQAAQPQAADAKKP